MGGIEGALRRGEPGEMHPRRRDALLEPGPAGASVSTPACGHSQREGVKFFSRGAMPPYQGGGVFHELLIH